MQEHDALISAYSHLKSLPQEKDALYSLQKIASLVKPIMRARGWRVGTLAEFYPDTRNLLGRQGWTCSPLITRLSGARNQLQQGPEDMPTITIPSGPEPVPPS